MNLNHLNDKSFLEQLDKIKIKKQYIKIELLSFKEEKIIGEIQGKILSGNISGNGNSSIRRTINFSMYAEEANNQLDNINNLISINKKIKCYIGYKNPFPIYDDILWFPCGIFIISTANLSRTTSGYNISVTGKDKMVQLNGDVGGTLPCSTTFHERYETLENNDILITYPTIYQIILESVNHIGEIDINKIFINDLDQTIKLQMKYIGDKPIWFFSGDTPNTAFVISENKPTNLGREPQMYQYNDDIGYIETDFTYPGELILSAGDTVVTLLDKIISILGNYEYFFDLNGNFIFQEQKNYLNNYYTPIVYLDDNTSYIRAFSDSKYYYILDNAETVISFTHNPNYDNFKNDFIVWGLRKSQSGGEIGIRYHVAIDQKPQSNLCNYNMFSVVDNDTGLLIRYQYADSSNRKDFPSNANIIAIVTIEKINEISTTLDKYIAQMQDNSVLQIYCKENTTYYWYFYNQGWERVVIQNITNDENLNLDDNLNAKIELIGPKCFDNYEWREELYRQALENARIGAAKLFYDEELIAEWRKLYDLTKWSNGWNPIVFSDPNLLDYWLDFIDTPQLEQYSVNAIGRRTKVVNNNEIKTLYNKDVQDIIFINSNDFQESSDKINLYNSQGQKWCLVTDEQMNYFATSSTGNSAYDEIRNLLYQHLMYTDSITITCQPKFYLEPNQLIYVEDSKSGILGDYVINSFSLPLAYNGTMTINASVALTRV